MEATSYGWMELEPTYESRYVIHHRTLVSFTLVTRCQLIHRTPTSLFTFYSFWMFNKSFCAKSHEYNEVPLLVCPAIQAKSGRCSYRFPPFHGKHLQPWTRQRSSSTLGWNRAKRSRKSIIVRTSLLTRLRITAHQILGQDRTFDKTFTANGHIYWARKNTPDCLSLNYVISSLAFTVTNILAVCSNTLNSVHSISFPFVNRPSNTS